MDSDRALPAQPRHETHGLAWVHDLPFPITVTLPGDPSDPETAPTEAPPQAGQQP